MLTFSPTTLDKLVARSKLPWLWFVSITGVTLILFAIAVAYLDGFIEEFFYEGEWRSLLVAPAIIIYILALQLPLDKPRIHAVEAFRALIRIDDQAFNRLVREASKVDNRGELIAFGIGATFGLLMNGPWQIAGNYTWLKFYLPLTGALMYGLLGWVIYTSLASTKLQSTLHQQPLEIDIFDLRAFEPIGRHSLFMALAFVGGSAVSVVFLNPLRNGLNLPSLMIYGILAFVAVMVFFLGMRDTHRVLAEAKAKEIMEVEKNIADSLRALKACKVEGGDIAAVSTELNLWLKYEERLKGARTWPYNTAMIRTVFLSALVPGAASFIQQLVIILFG